MRGALVFLVVLAIPTVALAQLDWYPKTTLAEDMTATWCTYCPYAYDGLDVMHGEFDPSVFESARYYATSGGLSSGETQAAINWYNVGGFPTVIFNGTTRIVGGSATIAAGGPYRDVIEAASFLPSPLKVTIDSFEGATGAIQVTVTMMDTSLNLVGEHVRFLLMEDHIWWNSTSPPARYHDHVTRDVINDTITLTGQGNTAVFNHTFDLTNVDDIAEVHAAAFVQLDSSQEILQAASSNPAPDNRVRVMVPYSRNEVGPSSGTYTSADFSVLNVGVSDTFDINLVVDQAPAGWTVEYCDAADNCQTTQTSIGLNSDEEAEYYMNVMPTSPGYMLYHFEVSSTLAATVTVPFAYFTNDLDTLIIDDDGGESYETFYAAALDNLGLSYGVWNRAKARLTTEVAQSFPFLIWNTGVANFPTLDATDRDFLRSYLDDGNGLFLTGQAIGYDLSDEDPLFYQDYLHAVYIHFSSGDMYVRGVDGDQVSNGLTLHITGGDGSSNQQYPGVLSAYDGEAWEMFHYETDGRAGALRVKDGSSNARIVYLAFSFEGIDNATDRNTLLARSVSYLRGDLWADGFETGNMSEWSVSTP